MASQPDFETAVAAVNKLASAPGPSQQLKLYGLYKQATQGDTTGKKPGRLDIKGRAKFEAWEANKGLTADDARAAYIAFAAELGAA